jgi:hypothetical protein
VRVDDLVAIAVNKLLALGRREVRDYIDLYVILDRGLHSLEALVPLAGEKDPGIAPYQARYLLIPLDWPSVVRFYERGAIALREMAPPLTGR